MCKIEAVYAGFKLDDLSLSDDNLMGFRVQHPYSSGIWHVWRRAPKEASMGLISN